MNITRQTLTYFFIGAAVCIAVASLALSGRLAGELAAEERNKMEIWASATEQMAASDVNFDMDLVLQILQGNTTIPVILYDESTHSLLSHNIRISEKDTLAYLAKKMKSFGEKHPPIRMQELSQALYYDDSYTLKQLQIYPYVQFFVLAVFVALAFFALNRSRRAEQNSVWVGLSKETAHQLGTPISSLVAWSEYLKMKEMDDGLLSEIGKDVLRLQTIAERFSKIGSGADLKPSDLREVVHQSLAYLQKRISDKVLLQTQFSDAPVPVLLNAPLFGWVIENLTKNAVDAMNGQGCITFSILLKGKNYILDVSDTGKGIPKSHFRCIFSPGFTTKERGWGMGLSLVKRIVEEYHGGKIFVKSSEAGKGTTFRIVLGAG